jgi:phosphoglycerol transferase MdoB-like AlkP superfamily enzyme
VKRSWFIEKPGGVLEGRDYFVLAFLLALGGWIGSVLLQSALYLRSGPHGGPFLAEWDRYFWLSLYYDLGGVWLLSLPFLLLWLILYRRPLRSRGWRALAFLQLGLLTVNLALSQIDHEVMRYLGVRLNLSFLFAYAQPQMLSDGLFIDLLRLDRGGTFVPLVLLIAVPAAYLWWGSRLFRRRAPGSVPVFWLALLLAIVPLAAPANGWRMATSQFRLRKVEPVMVALAVDAAQGYEDLEKPADFDRLARDHQSAWLARSTDKGWRFPDPDRPYLRVPLRPAPSEGQPWNIIYLQLETFRGVDMGFLNPQRRPTPTPYLDALARRPDSAVYTRALSFGMPSINGLFASHCSITPPSQRYITGYTHTRLLCLPELLRRRGYRTEMFNGGDTDWDNSSPWLRIWYDRLWRFPEAEGRDRVIFRAAAEGISRLGRSGRPFFASVVSVSNHTPFRSVEPALDVSAGEAPAERILNTTRYTDEVVREFLDSLRGEPWFDRTLIVITGDHGFNAGEHGQVPGQHDLYRESVWVPLIIAGNHPRLSGGSHDLPASLLDLAPTLADLLGIRVANPWQGHSLLAAEGGSLTFGFRESWLAETPAWSALRDPYSGRAHLYARQDWLQRHDLAAQQPLLAGRLLSRAERTQRLNDYLLRHDRVWR